MLIYNNEMINDVKIMALGFSYTDEIDESYEDSGDEDDFESLGDDALNKFDDDFDETIDEDDIQLPEDSYETEDYNDELSEDYSDSDEV